MATDTEHGGCGKCCGGEKPCAGGGCHEDCAVSCGGSETFGDEERLRRLVEYRDMLHGELESVEAAIAAIHAAPEAPQAREDQELAP
jgi:hypothetical protein